MTPIVQPEAPSQAPSERDPFFYGWRDVPREMPDGSVKQIAEDLTQRRRERRAKGARISTRQSDNKKHPPACEAAQIRL